MHQKKEDLEYVLREITYDFFIRKKRFSIGDWERYYLAKFQLNEIYLNEQNGFGFVEKILEYLQKKFDDGKNRKRLRRVCQNSANMYGSFSDLSEKIQKYNPREKYVSKV